MFQKGKSGNPSGRPKENPEIKALALAHCKMAIERLVFWANSENPKASVTAAIHILDRALGKAAQTTDPDNPPMLQVQVSFVEAKK